MGDNKKNNLFDRVSKSFFNKNDKKDSKKNDKYSDAYKQVQNIQINKKNQTRQYNVNQQYPSNRIKKSSSGMEIILNNRLSEVQQVLIGLVEDIQKSNPSLKEIAELITNLWKIGNTAKEYQENNQSATLNDILTNQEKILLDNIDEIQNKIGQSSAVDDVVINRDTSDETESVDQMDEDIIVVDDDIQIEQLNQKINELKNQLEEIKQAKNIIKDSLRPINSIVRQYEIILLKLSKYGFEIRDLTGETYSVNKNIDVKAFEHDSNIKEDIISETVKPEIYYKNQKILKAEVYVTLAQEE
ncbi:MAG: hypothetical protein E7Z84_01615 [Methanosphaera stadtmanae]|nr:hypothetical protein [Methanosphaera stadtmanae]